MGVDGIRGVNKVIVLRRFFAFILVHLVVLLLNLMSVELELELELSGPSGTSSPYSSPVGWGRAGVKSSQGNPVKKTFL